MGYDPLAPFLGEFLLVGERMNMMRDVQGDQMFGIEVLRLNSHLPLLAGILGDGLVWTRAIRLLGSQAVLAMGSLLTVLDADVQPIRKRPLALFPRCRRSCPIASGDC